MVKRTRLNDTRSSLSTLLVPALVACVAAAGCATEVGGGAGGSAGSTNVNAGGNGGTGATPSTGGMGGTGGAGGMGGAGGGMGGQGAGPMGCVTDGDCANDPGGTICDTSTGACVECLPSPDPFLDDCGMGQYCNTVSKKCQVGCTIKTDCVGAQTCDTMTNKCVGCVVDTDCNAGSICISNTCIPGCSGIQPCQAGFSCCGSSCYDLSTDENNCGFCNNSCKAPANGTAVCDNGLCALGACKPGFADCNQNSMDGCEWNVLQDGPCACVPGQTQSCYQGLPGTLGIGPCKAGTQTCKEDGSGWGDCVGQVLPKYEICANAVDDDCNGAADDSAGDYDGDGYSSCGGGDCCDFLSPGCPNPKAVNPGAFEFPGDGVDNDCDAATPDTPAPPCSTAEKLTGVLAEDVAKAIELCQFVPENPPAGQFKKWGVINSKLVFADGSTPNVTQLATLQDKSTAILTGYGTVITPKKGATMAAISSGIMRDQNDAGYTGTSTSHSITGSPPAAYLLANGGKLPSPTNCNGTLCPNGTGANDSVNVRLDIRVPTNAKSLSYQFRFFSSEYWSFQCTSYNDFFLAILKSGAVGLPVDKNIAKDSLGNPVSVNNGFFEICVPKGCNTCPSGTGDLAGTGMQLNNTGGGTNWLFNDASVVPGETITLELMVFDVGDGILDSLVLLDNFTWNAADLGTGVHE